MPKELHEELDKRARKMGLKKGTDAYNKYVYGTLAKIDKRKRMKHFLDDLENEEIDIGKMPTE